MTGIAVLLWLANMATDTGGQLAFKAAAIRGGDQAGLARWKTMAAGPWLWVGMACYVVEFFVWMAFLAYVELSVAIMLASMDIVAIMLAGRLLFRERLSPWRVTGICLVTCGVAIVGLGG